MAEIQLQLLNGLFVGLSLALVAAGLALIFGVLRVVNFAQGELVMLGAYGVVVGTSWTQNFAVAVLLSVLIVGFGGGCLMFLLLKPLQRGSSLVLQLLATLALSIILRQLAVRLFGGFIRTVNQPITLGVPVQGLQYPVYDLLIALTSAVALLATQQFLKRTRPGIWLRAVADNPSMAAALGVPLPRVYLIAFIVSAGLSALAGAMLAPVTAVYATLGQDVSFNAFVVIVAGGLGSFSVRRAAVFALVLGEVQALGSIWFRPVAVQVFAIGIVIVLLAVRSRSRPSAPMWSQGGARPLAISSRLLAIVLVLAALLPVVLGSTAAQRATPILVSVLLAAAVAVLLRFGGILNVGIGAVFGASAYTLAVFSGDAAAIWLAVGALGAAGLVSLLYGVYAGVASGVEYMMLTYLTTAAAAKLPNLLPALAGGANGLGVRDVTAAAFGIDPLDGAGFYVLALVATCGILGLAWLALSSQLGRVAEAAGRNPLRTASMGYRLGTVRVLLALLAGGLVGMAGWMYALQTRIVGQDVLGLDTSLNALIYALVGGVQQPIIGAALGAAGIRAASLVTASGGEPSPILIGVGLLVVVYALPNGILGWLARRTAMRSRSSD